MVPPIDIAELVAKNPGVDAKQLEECQRQSALFGDGQRYKYNLLPPFAGRGRSQMAECNGPGDNIREPR